MQSQAVETIIAVTSEDGGHSHVVDRVASMARETGATVILYDLDAEISPLESPLPTEWSGEGAAEQFGDRLTTNDLEAAGRGALADQVRSLRAAGIEAFGWLPDKGDAEVLVRYAARQKAGLVLLSTDDSELIDGLRSKVGEVAVPAAGEQRPGDLPPAESRPRGAGQIHVEAVAPG